MEMQAYVFDFDGTLAHLNIDFLDMKDQVRQLALAMGLRGEFPAGYVLEAIAELTPTLGPEYAARAHQLVADMEWEAAGQSRLYGWTRSLLRDLARGGCQVGIITRNSGRAVRRVFPDLDGYVQAFLPREAVTRQKPHPDHVLIALECMKVAPVRAAMVGDHPTDMEAGRAAGCHCIGVLSGTTSAADLTAAGAEVVLEHAGRLLNGAGV